MFILINALQLYALQQQRSQAARMFEARVKETETPGYVTREAPDHIRVWLSSRPEIDIQPHQPILLTKANGDALVQYLLSRDALGKVAAAGGGPSLLGGIPGVSYRLGERGMEALHAAISDYGIQIIDDRR